MKSAYTSGGRAELGNLPSLGDVTCTDATDMDIIRNRLSEVLNFVQCQGERLDHTVDKLTGCMSDVKSAPGQPRAVPSGMLGQMSAILDDIMGGLQRNDGVVSKLRSVI